MQHDAAHQLHVEMALAQGALGRLAHGGEGVEQDVVEALALGQALAQPGGARPQLVVAQRLERRLELVDRGDDRLAGT